jgi:hypothetical protein
MAFTTQPHPAAAWSPDERRRIAAQAELVCRSRELILCAVNSLLFRHTVEPGLVQELRHLEAKLHASAWPR